MSYKQNNMIVKYENKIKYYKNHNNALKKSTSNEDIEGVGILTISKINLKVVIGEGADLKTLKYAVGHFKGTALPGQKGNFCVAGHRSYVFGEYFNRLDELKIGDEIIVKTLNGEFKYKVYKTQVVLPSQVEVLNPSNDATMTLITCTPIRVATHRLIVKARLEN
ncbi:class D sortase [Clostridium sp. DMHC 10]|uniref:class D sortase n=1 Tax=Clostridium sp. DMHC 10 TaxID=747377 RepID=UPI001FA7E29D|nr:class D sortase [Clostridium sp. DMHC 10]